MPRPAGLGAEACGAAAASHLLEGAMLAARRRVALFASLADEIATRPIFERLRAVGRTALVPRMLAGGGLEFIPLSRWEDLRPGAFGVWTPLAGTRSVALGVDDLVLVPGLGFDRQGRRLGRGRGYYDRRFPPGSSAPCLVGLAFACQIVDEIPIGPEDRKMDALLTEHGWVRVPREGAQGDDG